MQASVEVKFIQLLQAKLKSLNTESLDETKITLLRDQLASFKNKGFQLIHQCHGEDPGLRSAIIRCPRNLVSDDDLPIVTLEVFRTTKEGISFAKSSDSIGLWCENISISFEFIHSLKNARQIWLNASHGTVHPKIPFYNGKIVIEDDEILGQPLSNRKNAGPTIQVADNIQFVTTFHGDSFQTVVIPFGESFAN